MAIFKLRMGQTPNDLNEEDYCELGRLSEGYSGSDIAVVVKEALMMPIRRIQNATKFKKLPSPTVAGETIWLPTYPSDMEGVECSLMQIDPSSVRAPDVTADDLYSALLRTKPSVSNKDI